ncbi:MAG: lysophospholipid transporter LplT [Methylococcaceae bacterium]|jgi:LPLT family lysophospholipid transporter-like MFS transporter|nr:lysophospholipid transporter LplT [Methylococcaceae bacterium]
MNRGLNTLVGAQFLSAFGDNAILFTVIAMSLQTGGRGAWYIPALQSAFLVAYVTLTPWVGALADRHPKPRVLLAANLVKSLGAVAIFLGVEPLLGYALIGVGAATYGPAKYGIIPELTHTDNLVRANGWVEGATIAAILLGTVGGARLADQSIPVALITVLMIYLVSAAATFLLPQCVARLAEPGVQSAWGNLLEWMKALLGSQRARLILLALSLFWACAATLRVVLVAWAPEVLKSKTASDIADLTFFMAIGIVIGAALVPRLIPLDRVRRTRFSAYLLGTMFLVLATVHDTATARLVLLVIGVCGGIFVVPLNAAIQAIGHGTIGSGSAVAVQNFFQNSAILLSMGLYSVAAAQGMGSVLTILVLGGLVWIMTIMVTLRLPKLPAR